MIWAFATTGWLDCRTQLADADDGELYTCGSNDGHQLGIQSSRDQMSLVRVEPLDSHTVQQIAVGESHMLGVVDHGQLVSWGSHERGQTGQPLLDIPHVLQQSWVSHSFICKTVATCFVMSCPCGDLIAGLEEQHMRLSCSSALFKPPQESRSSWLSLLHYSQCQQSDLVGIVVAKFDLLPFDLNFQNIECGVHRQWIRGWPEVWPISMIMMTLQDMGQQAARSVIHVSSEEPRTATLHGLLQEAPTH